MFFGKVPKGGGGISDPKNYIADFAGFKAVYFGHKFWKNVQKGGRGGGHRQSKKFHYKLNFWMGISDQTRFYEWKYLILLNFTRKLSDLKVAQFDELSDQKVTQFDKL